MKIKLSKSQWEKIGQETGWVKRAQEDEKFLKDEIQNANNILVLLNDDIREGDWKKAVVSSKNLLDSLETIYYVIYPDEALRAIERE